MGSSSVGEPVTTTASSGTTEVADGTTAMPSPPRLELSDGPLVDFGDVTLGDRRQLLLAVTNSGAETATGMSGSATALPFSFVGGVYPGEGGDCADSLSPGAMCLIVVELAPEQFGIYQGELRVEHEGGEASAMLSGRGVGSSANLLFNPGGEREGSPPPGWDDVGPGNWRSGPAESAMPFEGRSVIEAYDGPSGVPYVLEQIVTLSDDTWLELVDAGDLRLSFGGQARSRIGTDQHRVRLEIRDGLAVTVGQYESEWGDAPAWTELAHSQSLPVGTRSVVVALQCMKTQGSICSAYFDALELRVQYP